MLFTGLVSGFPLFRGYSTSLGFRQVWFRVSLVWRNYVRDVAVPYGFARPWWEVRLRGAVPQGSGKHAGVNAACRW